MSTQVIEGTWEEIKRHEAELIGRHLRVTIKSEIPTRRNSNVGAKAPSPNMIKKRLDALNAWLMLPRPTVTNEIDDTRAGIYGEDEDRG